MAGVFDSEFYRRKFKKLGKLAMGRSMWFDERLFSAEEYQSSKAYYEGLYVFGGMNAQGQTLNDLWLV